MFSPLIILGVAAVVAFVAVTSLFSDEAKVRRKLKGAPHQPLAGFRDGQAAKVVGRVEPVGAPLKAPLSGRPCAHYHLLVEEGVRRRKGHHWRTLIEETDSCRFLVRDGAHCAVIADRKVMSHIVKDCEYSSGFLKDATRPLEEFLRSRGESSEGFLGLNRKLRYREGVLERGEEVAVYGRGAWAEAESLRLPARGGRVLALSAPEDGGHVYLSDDPETTERTSENPYVRRRQREAGAERKPASKNGSGNGNGNGNGKKKPSKGKRDGYAKRKGDKYAVRKT